MPNQTFQRNERLKSKKTLALLFQEGKSFSVYPIRIVWLSVPNTENQVPFQFTVSVPKKKFPKAVDRNRIKRQVREAYRLNKYVLFDHFIQTNPPKQYAIMMIYVAKEKMDYNQIEKGVVKVLKRFCRDLGKQIGN